MNIARWRLFVCAALGSIVGSSVQAQGSELRIDPPPSALDCLRLSELGLHTPNYPSDALKSSKAAVVRVRMQFASSDQAPRVNTLFNSGGDEFGRAVSEFVSGYRLPCLVGSGGPVEATQEFQFIPRTNNPTVFWGPPRGRVADGERVTKECLQPILGSRPPSYPADALRRGEFGMVIARMTFSSADVGPDVDIVYDADSERLASAVRAAVARYRLPCVTPAIAPITAYQEFKFSFGEAESSLKKDLTLTQLLSLINDLSGERVRFDFDTMNCPFTVKFRPYRPYAPNAVGEVGETNSNRREFVEWLRNATLQIPAKDMKTVIGQMVTVAVPCTVLDLL